MVSRTIFRISGWWSGSWAIARRALERSTANPFQKKRQKEKGLPTIRTGTAKPAIRRCLGGKRHHKGGGQSELHVAQMLGGSVSAISIDEGKDEDESGGWARQKCTWAADGCWRKLYEGRGQAMDVT